MKVKVENRLLLLFLNSEKAKKVLEKSKKQRNKGVQNTWTHTHIYNILYKYECIIPVKGLGMYYHSMV